MSDLTEMVLIQGGEIILSHEGFNKVTIKDFYVGKYLVTQVWKSVMGNNPSGFKERTVL